MLERYLNHAIASPKHPILELPPYATIYKMDHTKLGTWEKESGEFRSVDGWRAGPFDSPRKAILWLVGRE